MKIWVDDIRPAPEGYVWVKSVNECISLISNSITEKSIFNSTDEIELIDLDHDAGVYAQDGGDYIKILEWIERYNFISIAEYYENEVFITSFHIHSMNPVGAENMRRIIQRNRWKEV